MVTNANIVDGHEPGIELSLRPSITGSPVGAPPNALGPAAGASDVPITGAPGELILIDLRLADCPDRSFAWPCGPVSGKVSATAPVSNDDGCDEDEADR